MTSAAKRTAKFGEQLTPFEEATRSAFTSGPAVLWISLFLFVPLLMIVAVSFLTRGEYGDIIFTPTLENYKRFLGFGAFGFDALYPFIILRSLILAACTTVLCMVLGLPLAFFIAGMPGRYKNLALTLVMIPFWTNLLIRTYAWQILLAPDGFITKIVRLVGLVGEGEGLYPSIFAVYIGMVCDYLPYLVLPLYSSVEKIDWSIVEAAMDLGANNLKVFIHALLPQVAPGLVAGIILVFIPAMGTFVIPDLLGGAKTAMLGNAIAQQFGQSRDWPFGSAVAVFGMAFLMLALYFYARFSGNDGKRGIL